MQKQKKEKILNPIVLSNDFKILLNKILKKGNSLISKTLINIENDNDFLFDISYIDRTNEDDYITFLPNDKFKEDTDPWTSRSRTKTKIGRLIRRLFGTKYTQQSVEAFINKYKAMIRIETQFDNFEVIYGEDIKYWYLSDNYDDIRGNLGNSCMQYNSCQKYFNIYTKNPNVVGLCILKNEVGDKIRGRALVWKLEKPKIVFMDRIYIIDEADASLFIEYAKNNNWHSKYKNGYYNDEILTPDGSVMNSRLLAKLDDTNFNKYPYLDTLRYYYPNYGYLANYEDYDLDDTIYTLTDTGGNYEEYDYNEPSYVTDWRGNEINENNAVWCNFDNEYCLENESIRVRRGDVGRGNHFIPNSPYLKYSEYTDTYYHKDDVIYSEFLKDWIYKKYAVKMYLDKNKNKWVWNHKLKLHHDMGKIGKDYFINDIIYRKTYEKDGKLVDGDYYFIDDDFYKIPLSDDPEFLNEEFKKLKHYTFDTSDPNIIGGRKEKI